MSHRMSRLAAAAASALLAVTALAACAPETGSDPDPTGSASADASSSPAPIATVTASPTPTAAAIEIPDDCREILNAAVLAELDEVPLNDPAFGSSGLQSDGSLICVWRDPASDTTGLVTTITYVARGPALDLLNGLADDEDFTCYSPDGGTRCEKTWENETYPVTDGRTLFWRDGILIDTQFSNLAPSGYTSAIVASLFG